MGDHKDKDRQEHGQGHGRHGHSHGHDHGHSHGHGGHGADMDWSAMGEMLERNAEVFEPLNRSIIDDLRSEQPAPGRIVDAGSGPGAISCLLAESFPGAEVIAVDDSEELLGRAAARAERLGLTGRVRTRRAALPDGIDAVGPADVIWLGQALHHIGDQRAALTALAGQLAPGGTLVLLEGGLPARHLPRDFGIGRPGLEARLAVVIEEWFTDMRASLPGAKDEIEDWPALLTSAGLRHTRTRSHLLDLPAPLDEAARAQIVERFTRYRESAEDRLDADDIATLDRLLDPTDEASLHHRADLSLLTAQTVYMARKP